MTTGRKITGLPLPETPREAPPELHRLVEAIEETLLNSDAMQAAWVLGRAFEYLTRYFSGVAGAIAQHLELSGDPGVAMDFGEARAELQGRMESLGENATDVLSKLVRGVFYVGATRNTPTPRRHARLLDLGGIPIRGYRNIDEWIAIAPGTGDLSNDSKANRELLRYLPILKEWLTATATYFLDAKQSELEWSGPNAIHFTVEAEGVKLPVGPIHLPEPLAAMLPRKGVAAPTLTESASETSAELSVDEPEPAVEVPEEVVAEDTSEPATTEPATAEPAADDPVELDPAPESPQATAEMADSEPSVDLTDVAPVDSAAAADPPALEPIAADPIPVFEAIAPVAEPIPPVATVEPSAESLPDPEGAGARPASAASMQLDPEPLEDNPFLAPRPAVSSTEVVKPEDNPFFRLAPALGTAPEAAGENPFHAPFTPPPTLTQALGSLAPSVPVLGSAEAVAQEDNPFAAPPSEPVDSTVMLNRDDFALDFGDLAVPSISPLSSLPPALPPLAEAEQDGEEPEVLEEPDDFESEELPLAASSPVRPLADPEPAGPPALPIEVEVEADASASGKRRVPPVLNFAKDKPSAPQISVSAPVQLYPVVTGPPPEVFDEIPVDADYPEVLQTALTDLNGAIEANDSLLICGQMQRCFDLMIQFFAGIAGSILQEIDSEALWDFEVEDGRFDLTTKLELVVSSLSALEEHWEGHDAATLVWSVFYDTLLPATDPNSAYLHTRLLGVEGLVPDTFMEFSELCGVVPGKGALTERSACRETAHRYLPILAFWLENATPLFLESEVDFVEEEGGAALSWAASVSGSTLDGTPSGLWLEVSPSRWNLPRPELAPVFVVGDAPDVLLPVVDELNAGLERKDFARAGLMVRLTLDFLIQYFAGCAAALWRDTGEMSGAAEELYHIEATLEEKERLLVLSLNSLSANTAVGASLGKLFSKSSLQYRGLTRRELPPGMGPLAEWAARRNEVGESDLLIYLPLLRSWLGAANPWFSAGEQLFEEPSDEGQLEGVVAFGDDFLEMVDPEYVIRLAPEILELVAPGGGAEVSGEGFEAVVEAPAEFTGLLPPMPILTEGPPVLIGHITRLLEAGDDRRAANAWIGSSFEYLIQYFAGLCTTVLGGKDAEIRKPVLAHFNPKASLREKELLLAEAVAVLKDSANGDTQEKIRDIFYGEDGELRAHTRFLGVAGPGSLSVDEMLLSFWCRVRHKTGTLNTEEFHFGMAALTSWVDAAKPFFSICEHYAEDPGADGQEEMVVELAEDYLDMVLPDYAIQVPARGYYEVLYRETEAVAADDAALYFPDDIRPELLGPKTTELGGIAEGGDDLLMGAATVELGGDDFFGGAAGAYDSDDLFSGPKPLVEEPKPAISADSPYARKQRTGTVNLGSGPTPAVAAASDTPAKEATPASEAEAETEAALRRRKKKRAKKAELGTAVMELYKKERLEKARKRAEARARKEQVEPTRLDYKLFYKGLKNSRQLGGRCHFGTIELRNAGGGELKGTVEPSHPSVKVQPARFEGNEVRVTYQIDPSDMPSTGRVGLSLNTQDERIELRMERLVPTSWSRERSTVQALGLMALPSVAYGAFVLYLFAFLMGPSLVRAFDVIGDSAANIPMGPKIKLWIFTMLAILPGATGVPAAVKMLFSRWDFGVQEELRKFLLPLMLLPSALMGATLFGTGFWEFQAGSASLPSLASKSWLMALTVGLNGLAVALFSTQTSVWWEDNSDSKVARRAFRLFWVATVAVGIVATFFMSLFT